MPTTVRTYLPGDRKRPRVGATVEDALKLLAEGYTRTQIARLWGVSRQRVTQILAAEAKRRAKSA